MKVALIIVIILLACTGIGVLLIPMIWPHLHPSNIQTGTKNPGFFSFLGGTVPNTGKSNTLPPMDSPSINPNVVAAVNSHNQPATVEGPPMDQPATVEEKPDEEDEDDAA